MSETAATLVVFRNFGAYPAVAALNLGASSAGSRPRSFTSVPCALARSRTSVGFSPLTDALRPARAGRLPPPARRTAATQRASMSRSARACPAGRPISYPVPSSPTRTMPSPLIAIKVIDQQNPYLLSHHWLLPHWPGAGAPA